MHRAVLLASVAIGLAFATLAIAADPPVEEGCQKLERDRPVSLAQASRIDGMTRAALMLLLAHAKRSLLKRTG
jgi:hypothetical protein